MELRSLLAGRNLSKMVPLSFHGDGTPALGVGKSWGQMSKLLLLVEYPGVVQSQRTLTIPHHSDAGSQQSKNLKI